MVRAAGAAGAGVVVGATGSGVAFRGVLVDSFDWGKKSLIQMFSSVDSNSDPLLSFFQKETPSGLMFL
jgi:hypothetical protein